MTVRVPFNKPIVVGNELWYISQTLASQHIASGGQFTRKCEEWLQHRLNVPRAVVVHSCTAALEMAALLCDLGPGDEVIMPSFTFVSTANAFVLRGAVPVFVDVTLDTLCLDLDKVEQAISPRTKAIVAVHYAGRSCDMERLSSLCKERQIVLIEDAAQALLSTYRGRYLGTFGDLSCLSFHETKNVISGEGGALLINNSAFAARAEILRDKGTNRSAFSRGQVDKYTWVDIGSSYGASEMIAAFLLGQLEYADRLIKMRRDLWQHYRMCLQSLEEKLYFSLPRLSPENQGNGHIFYLLLRSPQERNDLIESLQTQGFNAVFHYVALHSSPAGKRYARSCGDMSVTDFVSTHLLRLPLFYDLKLGEVEEISRAVADFYGEALLLNDALETTCTVEVTDGATAGQ